MHLKRNFIKLRQDLRTSRRRTVLCEGKGGALPVGHVGGKRNECDGRKNERGR